MAHRTAILGEGMTQREVVPVDDLDAAGLRALAESFSAEANSAWQEGGGAFGMTSIDAFRICNGVLEREKETRPFPADSPADFAKKFLDLHARAKSFIEQGRADLAAVAAWDAAMLFARADMKWRWEKRALSGQRRAEALEDARQRHNREKQVQSQRRRAQWQEAAAQYWNKNPTLSKTRVAQLIQTELGVPEKVDTIARQLQKVRKAG